MKILVFGATGRTGRCLVDQALEKNHVVTAAGRNPAKMAPGERLRVVECDVMDPAGVADLRSWSQRTCLS